MDEHDENLSMDEKSGSEEEPEVIEKASIEKKSVKPKAKKPRSKLQIEAFSRARAKRAANIARRKAERKQKANIELMADENVKIYKKQL